MLYYGDYKDNRPDGIGIVTLLDSSYSQPLNIYCGEFKDGLPNGFGIMFFLPEEPEYLYYPEFASEEEESQYIQEHVNYIKYIGYFKDNEFSGEGELIKRATPYTISYAVKWFDFENNNSDLLERYISGARITKGTFKNGEINGKVIILDDNQLLYEGEVKDTSTYHGEGTLYFRYSDKIQYKGGFKNGKYNGTGTLYDENGIEIYGGEWSMGDFK